MKRDKIYYIAKFEENEMLDRLDEQVWIVRNNINFDLVLNNVVTFFVRFLSLKTNEGITLLYGYDSDDNCIFVIPISKIYHLEWIKTTGEEYD